MMNAGDTPREAGRASDALTVLISAGAGEPDRLLMLGIPSNGRVPVREWSPNNWSSAADEREIPVEDVYAIFQRAFDARRRMNVALPVIRAWLDGRRS